MSYCITDKVRIYPKQVEIELFEKLFGCSRFIYNELLSRFKDRSIPEQYGMNHFGFDMFIAQVLQKEFDFLHTDCQYTTRNETARQFSVVVKNFFKRAKQGKKCKLKFKSKYSPKQSAAVGLKISADLRFIKLSKSKTWIRAKGMRDIDGKLVVAKIIKERDRYYVCLTYKCESVKVDKNIDKSVGIDLGLKDFAVTSDGQVFKTMKYYRNQEKKLAREMRKLSKKKGFRKSEPKSNNFQKQLKKVQNIHYEIKNQRKDYLHRVSSELVDNYDLIICENLKVANMAKNKKLSKSVYDQGWSQFFNMLNYKTEWQGKTFYQIGTFHPSSQLCSNCGYQNKEVKDLSIRKWTCPKCQVKHDRDFNASVNILMKGLSDLAVETPVSVCGEHVRRGESNSFKNSQAMQSSMKQKTRLL